MCHSWKLKSLLDILLKSHLLLIVLSDVVVRDFIPYLLFQVRAQSLIRSWKLTHGDLGQKALVYVELLMEACPIESLVESLT